MRSTGDTALPARRLVTVAILLGTLGAALVSCTPAARAGSLRPTLALEDLGGARVAVQNGIPVPTFDPQPRSRIDLIGPWRVERATFDHDLSLTDREQALPAILAEAAGRETAGFDDSGWETIEVPASLNPPPDGRETGAWYRRSFFVPPGWNGLAATLKLEAVNYLADAWVNGTYLGYHEGGYTPFAFDVSAALVPGERNVIALRVDNPPWGSRNDIVPWGLADWWNYGGVTQPLWIEATEPMHVVRADVVPHLDGIDVSVLVRRAEATVAVPGATPSPKLTASPSPSASPTPSEEASPPASGVVEVPTPVQQPEGPSVRVEVRSADINAATVGNRYASALVDPEAAPIIADTLPLPDLAPGGVLQLETGFLLGGADRWSPAHPALYVLHVGILDPEAGGDELWTTFGLRHVGVDGDEPRILLNAEPVMLSGVGLHDERIEPRAAGPDAEAGPAHRVIEVEELLAQLDRAREVDAALIRAGHTPANPLLLMLADRLGFAVWEEIPLYHYTPLTYRIAMDRGIPQQMLREMALRDMNRPSVLFHGLSNESTGTDEREAALRALHEVDREIDGTRLTGQAAYGSTPDDPTQAPLDVAGYTFYYGVFYGSDPLRDTAAALREAHDRHPTKPILALEFGRWADGPDGPERQGRIFAQTFLAFDLRSGAREAGYVGATVWWALEDFTTMRPGIRIEHFGLFDAAGSPRPAAQEAARLFAAEAGAGAEQQIDADVARAEVTGPQQDTDLRLFAYLAYALAFSVGTLGLALALLVRRGGRAIGTMPTGRLRL